jgi:hypothetical protein
MDTPFRVESKCGLEIIPLDFAVVKSAQCRAAPDSETAYGTNRIRFPVLALAEALRPGETIPGVTARVQLLKDSRGVPHKSDTWLPSRRDCLRI